MFKETKRILGRVSLSRKQIGKIRKLQLTVNNDSVNVAEKYLRINTTGQEHRISQILAERVREGNLSPAAIDQVKEFALLQKVCLFVCSAVCLCLFL